MDNFDRLTPDPANRSTNPDSDDHELYLMTSAQDAVPMELMQLIKAQVEVVLPALKRDERYTVRMLCDDMFWNELTHRQRTNAGKCMAYMVGAGMLPLTFAGRTDENSKLYRLP